MMKKQLIMAMMALAAATAAFAENAAVAADIHAVVLHTATNRA